MIELTKTQKVIDQNTVLDIEALNVKAGEIAALVGPVDSGKEVLFILLTGQSRPTVGEIRIAGVDPRVDKDQFSRQVGVLFAEDGLYTRQTPLDNLLFHCRLRGLPRVRAEDVLAQVGLGDQAGAKLDNLPSGLVRRLAFGRAILHEPEILLLVEPFARCDGVSIELLGDLIRQQAQAGVAVLILTDDSTNLSALCDKVYVLDQGRIVDSYSPQEEEQHALPFKIPVRLEGRVALVNPADILYADAESGRATLQTTEGRLPTQFTLAELEERLGRSGFFRAHRGYLVNLQHVKEVIPFTRNSFILRLDDVDNTEIPLSKSAAAELKDLLGY
ncbi:MAG: LytTR family transcriptional regulator DNA-binding domain-containing protein [Anaerolineales bacterium]|nr:LytTR family transcriptional regulator DNA-binding domain-containing protein [Anaerolineales bacterium]